MLGASDADALATAGALCPHVREMVLSLVPEVPQWVMMSLGDATRAACTLIAEGEDAGVAIREGKRRGAFAVAVADLLGEASVAEVTEALSALADAAIARALSAAAGEDGAPGLFVLALGKLGGGELNYSSDVDLVALFEPGALTQPAAVKVVQRMARLLSERTAHGYGFRVDLRLRPDPGSTPVAVTTTSAVAYLRGQARAWERQALIKARFVAGDSAAAARYLAAASASVWPSAYDFSAIQDATDMRAQMAAVRGAGLLTLPGHNVKLGRGGIREIEFMVQSLQRVAGGRDRALRGKSTVLMARALARAGWLDDDTAGMLCEHYDRLRRVEHRLQMINDEQTHTMPRDAAGLARMALLMREPDFVERTEAALAEVHAAFLALQTGPRRRNPALPGPAAVQDGEPAAFAEFYDRWMSGSLAAFRTDRARAILERMRPVLCAEVCRGDVADDCLSGLDLFFSRLRRGVELLSRLERHPELIGVLCLVVSAAPRLAEQFARRDHILDVLIDPAFFGQLPQTAELAEDLAERLEAEDDYEARLDVLRVFGQEHKLLIEVRILTGSLAARAAGAAYTALADVVVQAAFQLARTEFEARHGRLRDGEVCILALGKCGSGEMTATSDLDLVYIYECAADAGESDGAKPLSPGHYHTRLAQRLIAALSAPTSRGSLYEVDMRLRPSGRAGPLATHLRAFRVYHQDSAWVWEHMALTRARVLLGAPALADEAMAIVLRALNRPRDADELRGAVLDMRVKVAAEHSSGLKHAPGGLVDIDFVVQYAMLRTGIADGTTGTRQLIRRLASAGALGEAEAEALLGALILMQNLGQVFAIAGGVEDLAAAPTVLQRILLRAGEAPDIGFLTADLAERQAAIRAILEHEIGVLAEAG